MSGVAIHTSQVGGDRLSRFLASQVALASNPRPIWRAVGAYGEASTRLRFRNQVDPDFKRWVPSARAQASGGKTLVHKRRLLGSISHRTDQYGAEWGSNVISARIHNEGGEIKPKAGKVLRFRVGGGKGSFVSVKKVTMPKRQFLGVNEADGYRIEQVAVRAISESGQWGQGNADWAGRL